MSQANDSNASVAKDAAKDACGAHPGPWATAQVAGTGGRIKLRPDDFLVTEVAATEPTGSGEHLVLFLRKREMSGPELEGIVRRAFGVGRDALGVPGTKDKWAVTAQHMSVHLPREDRAAEAAALERIQQDERVEVLWAQRHERKLRQGHHGGNQFQVRIREVGLDALPRALAVVKLLQRDGMPNAFGLQRFGVDAHNGVLGGALLRGDGRGYAQALLGHAAPDKVRAQLDEALQGERPNASVCAAVLDGWPTARRSEREALLLLAAGASWGQLLKSVPRWQARLLSHAWQSEAFNRVLAARVADGSWCRLLPGDLAVKIPSRAFFRVDAAAIAAEQAPHGRMSRGELSASGPQLGPGMVSPEGEAAALETAALAEWLAGQDPTTWRGWRDLEGGRRPLRVMPKDLHLEAGADEAGPYLHLEFTLPRGSYATSLLAEVIKPTATSAWDASVTSADAGCQTD